MDEVERGKGHEFAESGHVYADGRRHLDSPLDPLNRLDSTDILNPVDVDDRLMAFPKIPRVEES